MSMLGWNVVDQYEIQLEVVRQVGVGGIERFQFRAIVPPDTVGEPELIMTLGSLYTRTTARGPVLDGDVRCYGSRADLGGDSSYLSAETAAVLSFPHDLKERMADLFGRGVRWLVKRDRLKRKDTE